MMVKTVKTDVARPFSIISEWNHNHPVNKLQALNFKDIPPSLVNKIYSLYERYLTPTLAYREYMSGSRNACKNLNFV